MQVRTFELHFALFIGSKGSSAMADEAVVGAQADDDEMIFVYMGGDQVVPMDIRRVRIHKSVKNIPRDAFYGREHLIDVEFHDGIEIVEAEAFHSCFSLRSAKLLGVKIIKTRAFSNCFGLTDVEFNSLETIEQRAFCNCTSLRSITMPSVRTIGKCAFIYCYHLTDLYLPEALETIQEAALYNCKRLRRITMPLNCMIGAHVFGNNCSKLTSLDLVGGIHNTTASLHLESWRNEMKDEINRINQVLPSMERAKTAEIQQWMSSVISQLDHYKAEHKALLKEATTLLELAL